MSEELLLTYIKGETSDQETKEVVAWLNEDEANRKVYESLSKVYYYSLFNIPKEQKIKKSRTISLKKISIELLKIAAIFLLVWGLNKFLFQSPEDVLSENYLSVYAPAGQRSELVLPDSTKVWLNAKSKISYPVQFGKGKREVEIEGEAYFDVKRDTKSPFIVKAKDVSVKVLGTEFNIISYPDTELSDITLLNGNIELLVNSRNESYEMSPNERIRLNRGKLYRLEAQGTDYFKWRDGLLVLNNESVESIFHMMELYFNVTIVVENKKLLKYRYSGKFRIDDGAEQMLRILQLEHDFTYTRDNELNLITIK